MILAILGQEHAYWTVISSVAGSSKNEKESGLRDQKNWSIAECAQVFSDSCRNLKNEFEASIIEFKFSISGLFILPFL